VGKRVNKAGSEDKLMSQPEINDLNYAAGTADDLTADADQPPEALNIRSNIEQTRSNMSETINALQEKLDPERITAQLKETVKETAGDAVDAAKQSVRDATIGRAERMATNVADTISDMTGIPSRDIRESGSSVIEYISERPLAFTLLGLGLGMLAFGGRGGGERRYRSYDRYRGRSWERSGYDSYYDADRSGARRALYGNEYGEEDSEDRYRGAQYSGTRLSQEQSQYSGGRSSGAASGIADSARDMAERTGEAVSSAASTIRHTVKDTVTDAADYAREVPAQVRSQARVASYRLRSTVYSNPMIAGVAAFSVGAILGLALPETEAENRYLGEASDELAERARSVASDATETVKRVATETGDSLQVEYQSATDKITRGAEKVAGEIKTDVTQGVDPKKP